MSSPSPSKRIVTTHKKSAIDREYSTGIYELLRDNVSWDEGVRSKNGFTRLAKALDFEGTSEIEKTVKDLVCFTIPNFKQYFTTGFFVHGVYLNYLKNEKHYVPAHSHPGMVQLVISLGATRTLTVGKKEYPLESGDAILFGASTHAVKREESSTGGRISIAVFIKRNI